MELHADAPPRRDRELPDPVDPGAPVRRRLADNASVHRVPVTGLEIFLVRDFLDGQECAQLIKHIDSGKRPSGLLAPTTDPEFRTSETCCFSDRLALVSAVERRIDALLGIDGAHGEKVQGQRYGIGQQFKPHHDFFHTDQAYWTRQKQIAGQRTWTAMAFLNEPEAGGKTFFPIVGLRVAPRLGNLLIWNNLDGAGRPNHWSLHQGLPVEAGMKYILTKWYRERPMPKAGRAVPGGSGTTAHQAEAA
jgi:prolyl 4-hydroxylase